MSIEAFIEANERKRVALLLDSPSVPAWLHRIIRDVSEAPAAELVLAFFDTSAPASQRWTGALSAYEWLDRRLFPPTEDPAARIDLLPLLAGCPRRDARPHEAAAGFELESADLEALRAAAPDLILKLGFPALGGEILKLAPLGVWSFDHLERARDGTPPYIWEMLRGERVSASTLRATTAAGTRVLARSWWPVERNSLNRMQHAPAWNASGLVLRALDEADGPVSADATNPEPAPLDLPRRAPNLLELARLVGGLPERVIRNRYRLHFANDVWFVALRRSSGSLVEGALDGFRPVPQPPDRFYADPFLVEDAGRTWLFFEDASLETGKGLIRCAEVQGDAGVSESRVVLERDHHLSYPFVFRRDGEWFMLPETAASRGVELWRAVEFPWRWTHERTLLADVDAYDPTLLEHEGRLWLFCHMCPEGGAPADKLCLFHADSLLGEWQPHPRNPVVTDVRRARPAGRLFVESGQLYRPAQDCAGEYGAEVRIHRVEQLDRVAYRESFVRSIDPSWWPGAHSTHTISRAGGFDAIDARLWLRRGRRIA